MRSCIKATAPVKMRQVQRMPHTSRENQEWGKEPRKAGQMPGPGLAAQASDYHLDPAGKLEGSAVNLRSKPHFDSQLVHWLSELLPRINSRALPTREMGLCFPSFSTPSPQSRGASTSISRETRRNV